MTCPVCGGVGAPKWQVDGHRYRACPTCGAWFLSTPAEADYTEAYHADGASRGYPDYEADAALYRADMRRNLAMLEAAGARGRLLDVGCATGPFLELARDAGFVVEGLEPGPDAARIARQKGLVVHPTDLAGFSGSGFDCVTLWETLEHLPRPVESLRTVAAALRPGGLLGIATGDHGSPLARALGPRWWYLVPPDHCVIYNRSALEHLLGRAGFRIRARHRLRWHRVSLVNAAHKISRGRVLGRSAVRALSRRLPPIALPIWHGTTQVVVAERV